MDLASFVVTLGLDAAQFVEGQKSALNTLDKTKASANVAAAEISAAGQKAGAFFGHLRNEFLAIATVFLGGMGIRAFTQNITASDAATGRLSRALGISTELLTAWQAVLERSGGSSTSAAKTFGELTARYQSFLATGDLPGRNYLQMLGINDPNELRDIPSMLMKIGDTIERTHMDPARAISLMAGAGITDTGTQGFLLKSHGQRAADLGEAGRLGVASREQTQAAERVEAAWKKTRQAVNDVGREILTSLSPALTAVLIDVNLWLSNDENRKWLRDQIIAIAKWISAIAGGVNRIVQDMGGWVRVTEVLVGLWGLSKFAGMTSGLIRLLGLIAAIPGSALTISAMSALGVAALAVFGLAGDTPTTSGNSPAEQARIREDAERRGIRTPGQAISDWWHGRSPGAQGSQGPTGMPGVPGRGTGQRPGTAAPTAPTVAPTSDLRGADVAAFIMHHTGGRGTTEGVRATLRARGLGVEYVMDRDGNITTTGGRGSRHIQPGSGRGAGLSNANTVGMEIIANDDRDITPAQIAAAKRFIAENYPHTRVLGHGEVNPGHKQATEGKTVTDAINADRALREKTPRRVDPVLAPSARNFLRAPVSEINTHETHIGHLEIRTAATDGTGIARDIAPALRRYGFAHPETARA